MMRGRYWTVCLHVLLIVSPFFTENNAQFLQQAPSSYLSANLPTVSKGYYQSTGNLGYYYSHPVNAQYWTGHPSRFVHHSILGPQYAPNSKPSPQYYQHKYFPQQYNQHVHGLLYQQGYSPYNSMYPSFDARFWSGKHNPALIGLAYSLPVPVYHAPVYHSAPVLAHRRYYHSMPPHYHQPYNRGFLSGTDGGLAESLLGAVLVGAIAKVASGI